MEEVRKHEVERRVRELLRQDRSLTPVEISVGLSIPLADSRRLVAEAKKFLAERR
jgi:hypothetical protein